MHLSIYLHELGHFIAIKIVAKNLFNIPVKSEIVFTGFLKAYTSSELFSKFELNPSLYRKCIVCISISGAIFSVLMYSILLIFLSILSYWINWLFSIAAIFFLMAILVQIGTFFSNSKESVIDGVVKSQPDFFLVLHPEKFRNLHPYKDDSIKK